MLFDNFSNTRVQNEAMAMLIREASPQDLDTIVRFNAAMARETENKDLPATTVTEGVQRVLNDPDCGRYFLAEIDDQVVGQLMFTLEWSDWRNGWFWWIQSVYVAPDWRRKKVFSALYKHLEKLAQENHGVCGLRLYVESENRRAQEAYDSLGMKLTGYRVMEAEFGSGDSNDA